MSHGVRRSVAALLVGWACTVCSAAEFFVSSASDIDAAMNSAGPGDTLIMTDGLWTDESIDFEGDGLPGQPITLRAQTPGSVVLNGSSTLRIGGSHLVVEGLRFEGGALSSGHIVQFRVNSNEAEHCVLRDTAIIGYNPPSINTRYFWVSMYGSDNVVENCRFENHNHSGVTIVVWGDWPNNHTIRHNHFVDRPVGPENGWETIRLGTSGVTQLSSQTVIESNLFERTNGEIEVISDKTQDNVHRYNTFREMAATLTLRHATNARVHGNFFLGENVGGSGGIRVIGPGHRIWNNYFQDLAGRADAVIALEAGESDGPASGYEPVTDAIIAHNTIIDCGDPAFALNRSFGGNRDTPPSGVVIVGNLVSSQGESVAVQSNNGGVSWEDNIAFASGLGTAQGSGVTQLGFDPLSTAADGLERPSQGGPADSAVSPLPSFVTDDMDGQSRASPSDAGSDEISAGSVVRGPLSPGDVGPAWWDQGPVDGPDPVPGVILEAEEADEIRDPDGDGDVFEIVPVPAASADAVLEAPSGSRTDLSSDPHETIAVYRVTPPSSGSYTIYVLARGFSTSTDSLFLPTAFGTDPDDNTTTSSNGLFEWAQGESLAYDAAQGEVELRLGRRESGTQIDGIVLYPSDTLSTSDLDYLLSVGPVEPCAVDLDGNGSLDFFDMLGFLESFDAGDPAADLSGNGELNSFDIFRYLNDYEIGCP